MRILALSILIFCQFIALSQSNWSYIFDTLYVKKHRIHCIEMDIPLLKSVDSDFFHHCKVCFTKDGLPASTEYTFYNTSSRTSYYYNSNKKIERTIHNNGKNIIIYSYYKYEKENRLIEINESCTKVGYTTVQRHYTWLNDSLEVCKNIYSSGIINFDTLRRDGKGNVIYYSYQNPEQPRYTSDSKELIPPSYYEYFYNAQNKMIKVIHSSIGYGPKNIDRSLYETIFSYDSNWQLLKMKAGKTSIIFDYTVNGFLKSEEKITDSTENKTPSGNYKVSYQYTLWRE